MNIMIRVMAATLSLVSTAQAPLLAQATRTAPAQPASAPQLQLPPPEAMIIMIRSTLVALSHANFTNNYTVLNGLGSRNFQQANPPARLGQMFTNFRTNRIDLNPVVYLTPQLSRQPAIENGRLHMVGFFPSAPMRVNFDLQFEPEAGLWRLFGVSVNLTPVQGQ